MRDILFYLGTEIVTVRINQKIVTFMGHGTFSHFLPIDSMKLSKEGVIKEFPYLQDSPSWREEAIVLFKKHIEALPTEDLVEKYIISDLGKHGYSPKVRLRPGFRPEALNG